MSSLECKSLCIVINFLVPWSFWLSSFLVHFKNGSDYLTKRTAQVFIPFRRFLLDSFFGFEKFSRSFKYSPYFSSSLLVSWCLLPIFPSTCNFPSLRAFWFFLVWHFYYFRCSFSPIFIMSMSHFSLPNSIPISWLYILIVCIRVSSTLSFWQIA